MAKVIIVGGGLAGLACAKQLLEHGETFELFEASDAVGGRVRTDVVDGFRLDRGFQVLLTAYPAAQSLLNYQQLDLKRFQPGALIRFRGGFSRFVDPWRQPQHFFSTAFSPLATFADKLRVGKLRSDLVSRSMDDIMRGEDQSTLDFLKSRGFSQRIIDSFFRPFFGGVFLESDLQTTARKMQFVFKMFSGGDAAVPAEGMQRIPEQLLAQLPPDHVHLNSPVDSVSANEVRLRSGEEHSADAVVLAVDASAAARLLPAATRPGATGPGEPTPQGEPEWNAVRCLYFAADRVPLNEPILVLNGDESGPINNLCNMTAAAPQYSPDSRQLISVSVLGREEDNEALLAEVRRQLVAWYGAEAEQWKHLKTHHVRHGLPKQPPGFTPAPLSHESGVICCGDHHGLASIQSAFETGRNAAELVLELIHLRTRER